ncbi:hypothetical protein GCM10011380_27210 [Sphingomonas metalli]|uniref:Aerotolerance regulator N-terminal domain-containing protein n=1 Tax=Sphingomonas metalli TaxID=1779358 RepID=A0A916WWY0_9SPHN|nr:BatA domain-containing protein [Sphingomonas metalli]GGB36371.1 hypothetical protein GCM10011380_27210 [Sphingomonas metalli]
MPVLLFPVALAALATLLVPLAIHLARRTETRPIDFAALRWLRQKPRPRHRPRFDEPWLLALRLLLLALIALWLAKPALPGSADRRAVIAYAPGLTIAARTNVRQVWLAPGFPAVEAGTEPPAFVPLASLIRELDADLPAGVSLTLVVPARLDGLDAERPRLSRRAAWRIVAGGEASAVRRVPPPELSVRYAPERAGQLRYWRALAAAWQVQRPDVATLDAPPGTARMVIWWAGGVVPKRVFDRVATGTTVLVPKDAQADARFVPVWWDSLGAPLAEAARIGRGRLIRLNRDLTPAAMPILVEPGFAAAMQDLLSPSPPPGRAFAVDYAPLTGGPAPDEPVRDLAPWLALVIALVWLAERWLATRRRRGVSP